MTNNDQVNLFYIQGMIWDKNLFFGWDAELAGICRYLRKGSDVSNVPPKRKSKTPWPTRNISRRYAKPYRRTPGCCLKRWLPDKVSSDYVFASPIS